MGSLVTSENQPSTAPLVSGVGSNPAPTVSTCDAFRWLACRNAVHTALLAACTPILLPTRSRGVLRGLEASDMMHAGLFGYWAPITVRPAPPSMAAAVGSRDDTAIRTLPARTAACGDGAVGPPGIRRTALNPSSA